MDHRSGKPAPVEANQSAFNDRPVIATELIRRLHGGAQSLLVRCDDGKLYALKLWGNPQGPNILANELIGSQLLGILGLPTPCVRLVHVTDDFIGRFPGAAFQMPRGSCAPSAGIHFGSDVEPGPIRFPALSNVDSLIGMYIFDTWAFHTDRRQYLYAKGTSGTALLFIDNGHLFGGPHWEHPANNLHKSLALRSGSLLAKCCQLWGRRMTSLMPGGMRDAIRNVPREWFTGNIGFLEETFNRRLTRLEKQICG